MMHPTLATIPTPPHLAPWVPPVRNRSVAVRFELGQIAPEPVPPVQYQPMPDFDPTIQIPPRFTMVCVDVARGPGCGETFHPKRSTAQRCPRCKDVRWHGPSPIAPTWDAETARAASPRARAKRYAASRRQAA